MKRDVVGCATVFVANFVGYVSAKNCINWMKVMTNIKKGDVFLRHSVLVQFLCAFSFLKQYCLHVVR